MAIHEIRTQVQIINTTFQRISAQQIRAIIGIIIAFITLVLTVLALTAGSKPGFMEDYHILLFNTSTLGQNLIPTPTNVKSGRSPTVCGTFGGALGNLCSSATAAVESAISSGITEVSGIQDNIAGKLVKDIGIQQWYSVHVMDVCQGSFIPNSTAPGSEYNVTNCTQPLKTYVGPLHLNLAKLGITTDLQNELDKIPGPFQALGGLYILAVTFSALSLILCAGWLYQPSIGMSWANVVIALLAAFVLFVGNIVATASGKEAAKINNLGEHIGISVSTGQKFAALTWVSFVLAVVMAIYWGYQTRQVMKIRKLNQAKKVVDIRL
ncbi:actin cortical patch SUR7/pH-response regulator pali [Annulohypoxylon truncatum]|uniref:actin cortical patch SUR7/pH-response regulator pali n=1 Tax=Annulohypoxylon truncatum TaxID=327061 RepID=UPI0020076C84|nr:actin cortical patch SUR7/pH-response regulator pali [Annulohypoxylon truncatum]KAI1207645.1 actin cortical patch SUR7/pH-response regulator pali [Annulohypoxylon truncatum]